MKDGRWCSVTATVLVSLVSCLSLSSLAQDVCQPTSAPGGGQEWKLEFNHANYGAHVYGDNSITHCECRQACLDLPDCSGYDWYPYGNSTKCWVGNNCPADLTYDMNNEHYTPIGKLYCYNSYYSGAPSVRTCGVWILIISAFCSCIVHFLFVKH